MFFYFVEITNSFFFSFFSLFSNYLGKFRMFSFFLLVTLFMDGTTKNSIKISCSFFSTKNQSINKMIESNQYANRETKRIVWLTQTYNLSFVAKTENVYPLNYTSWTLSNHKQTNILCFQSNTSIFRFIVIVIVCQSSFHFCCFPLLELQLI